MQSTSNPHANTVMIYSVSKSHLCGNQHATQQSITDGLIGLILTRCN